ncbi:site-2 protease family protein [Saccharothrix coeruleofusca]|uniref:site-2 protease family protein n=1 Tax=Saccharothrix coeruleofusca TaxID=33919 RepID=UPI001670AAC9|nr:site-2 protease family protein [Saccharothrix coeruleofusca]MBP2339107.1 Zn-dependent protease [Saccharothrix coeruleofusca]
MKRSAVLPSPLFLSLLAATVAGAVLTVLESEAAVIGGTVLFVLGGWAVSLCLHEFGHAIVAYRGGDYAVRAKGYLTLDIRHYTDPVLSIVLPLVLLAFGGIPLPGGAVWINHHALRSKRVESMVSLAGPLSNLVLGALLSAAVLLLQPPAGLAAAMSYLALLQVFAFVLNILPIPGLDGWGAIEPYMSYSARQFGAKARQWAPFVLFAVLIGFPSIARLFFQLADTVFDLVGGNSLWAAYGQATFMFWR